MAKFKGKKGSDVGYPETQTLYTSCQLARGTLVEQQADLALGNRDYTLSHLLRETVSALKYHNQ